MVLRSPVWLVALLLAAAAASSMGAMAGVPSRSGDVQALLAIAKVLDPTGKALPKWRANNTNNWCKEWLANKGCVAEYGVLTELDISQAGLRAAAPLRGTLPQQLPQLTCGLKSLRITGTGVSGRLPAWVLQIAERLEIINTSMTGPLPAFPASPQQRLVNLRISANPKLSGTLPPSWSNALSLEYMVISGNAITGSIPDAWSNMDSLQHINLARNKLSGSISRAWVQPSNAALQVLNVAGNVGMKGCLLDAKGKPGASLPFVNASGTSLLDCVKSKPVLTQFHTPQAGWSPAKCDVDGYTLKAQHLPDWSSGDSGKVQPYVVSPSKNSSVPLLPLATLAETQAACDASNECVMFTSDGYLIGVYTESEGMLPMPMPMTPDATSTPQPGPWQSWQAWRKMAYCSGRCCGTWVSKGTSTPAGNTGSADAADTPKNAPPQADVNPAVVKLAASAGKRCQELRAGVANSFTCPSKCRVACCLQSGQAMSNTVLNQCSTQVCRRSCGFKYVNPAMESTSLYRCEAAGIFVALPAGQPYPQKFVTYYQVQKARGGPKSTGSRRKAGGAQGCTGSLC